MAKNDYYVIAYRILAYIYACLKEDAAFNPEEISYERLAIPESYWNVVAVDLVERGYIKDAFVIPVLRDGKRVKWGIRPIVTMEGVEFLHSNSMMGKAKEFLKTLKETIPGL